MNWDEKVELACQIKGLNRGEVAVARATKREFNHRFVSLRHDESLTQSIREAYTNSVEFDSRTVDFPIILKDYDGGITMQYYPRFNTLFILD